MKPKAMGSGILRGKHDKNHGTTPKTRNRLQHRGVAASNTSWTCKASAQSVLDKAAGTARLGIGSLWERARPSLQICNCAAVSGDRSPSKQQEKGALEPCLVHSSAIIGFLAIIPRLDLTLFLKQAVSGEVAESRLRTSLKRSTPQLSVKIEIPNTVCLSRDHAGALRVFTFLLALCRRPCVLIMRCAA